VLCLSSGRFDQSKPFPIQVPAFLPFSLPLHLPRSFQLERHKPLFLALTSLNRFLISLAVESRFPPVGDHSFLKHLAGLVGSIFLTRLPSASLRRRHATSRSRSRLLFVPTTPRAARCPSVVGPFADHGWSEECVDEFFRFSFGSRRPFTKGESLASLYCPEGEPTLRPFHFFYVGVPPRSLPGPAFDVPPAVPSRTGFTLVSDGILHRY